MKKSKLLLMVFCILAIQLSAQHKNPEKEKESAKQATQLSTTSLEKLIAQKSDSYVITNENVSKKSGIRHVYLRQAINGLEIYGTESSVHIDKTGRVLMEHNKFLVDVQATLKNSSQGIDAPAAINAVANQMGYKVSNLQEIKSIGGNNKAGVFNKAGISLVDIPAKLMYYYKEGIGTQLVWELSIAETFSSDWWNFRVDASTGKIIDKDNWTVSCNIMDAHNEHFHSGENVALSAFIGPLNETETPINHNEVSETTVSEVASALIGGYRVYAMPTESPNHGPRTLQINPDNPTASPFGWHDTNGVAGPEFTVTTGNNVDAHKGAARPDGTASLTFDFAIDLNQNPASNTAPYITNLFYWNNIIHDVLYQYGFDEASGNFQENNYGNGGVGSDSVNANAQASGDCNANFGTPADGGNPTMNMFLCSNSSPSHDGDLDAGVITHEYCHGVSNRLTGGALNVNCLNNIEQMGEGWSDFYGILLTIEPGDTGTDARGVGTYLLGQPITGNGVRTKRYSTDFAVNNHTYNDIKVAVAPHGVGEIWATMLWDMTWGIIGTDGFDADVYNGTGGNNVALSIVTEGLKLQVCSPGFVDGRDAIIAADQALYGGAHICTIWEAFARRGLGFSASQGSSSSKTDGTEAFDLPPSFSSFDTIDEVCLSDGIQTGLSGGNPAGGTYSGAGVTDDGNGNTFTFDPTVGGPGLVTITYTVNDFCTGAPTILTDDINVTNDPPEIVCMGSGVIPMTGSQSSSPAAAIPDNNTTGVTVNMNVTENVAITDLDVNLNISHTWVGDIIVKIKSPSGTSAIIIDRPGRTTSGNGCSGNNIVAILNDEAATPVENECAGSVPTINGSFTPNNPLSIFDGESTLGIWQLTVSDNAGGDTGTINSWGIDYDYEVTAPVLDVTLDGSGNATINAEDLLYSVTVECGGYTVLGGNPLAATVSFSCSDTGLNTVAVEVTNDSGATTTCSAIVNVIGGGGGGGPLTCPGDITQDNDPGICGAVVTYTVDSPSGCGGGSGTISQTFGLPSGNTFPVGTTTNTFEYDDGENPVQICSFDVTIEDTELPVANCAASFTVQLDANGMAIIIVSDIDNGSTDNCVIASTSIDITNFTCADIGPNNVTLTVTDVNGNSSTCVAVVTVEDDLPPTLTCPSNITANTDAGMCSAGITFSIPTVLDNCSATVSQTGGLSSGSDFPVGVNTIEFTATDAAGNTTVCSFTITVSDNELPTMMCQNITIQLDNFGNASITATDVDGGSADNCGIASLSVNPSTFDCSDVGDNPVVLTVTDIHGNSNTCTAIVTVEDVTPPEAVCQNITVELDPVTGTVTITGADVDGGSTDACGIGSYSLDIDTFDCSNVGDNTVVLTVTDVNANVSTCSAIVTVEDNTAPILVCQNFTLALGPDGTAVLDPNDVIASNSDNCGIGNVDVDINEFSCANIGNPATVQVFTSDVNGNLSTCNAIVTVVDLLAPVITCPADQTIDLEPGNLFYILPDYFATGEATAIDNCTDPVTITTQDPAAGTELPDGVYTITLTAEDEYGNVSTCSFELTVTTVLGAGDHNAGLGSIQMYPNPTKNTVMLGNPANLSLEILQIFDIRGRMVKTIDLRNMGAIKAIDVSEMAAATYLVIIQGENGQITKRLIKE